MQKPAEITSPPSCQGLVLARASWDVPVPSVTEDVTCSIPQQGTHQLGVGCSSEGEGFPQEDSIAPHVRLGGEFLQQQEGRGWSCLGSVLSSHPSPGARECLPPANPSSLGCEPPPFPSPPWPWVHLTTSPRCCPRARAGQDRGAEMPEGRDELAGRGQKPRG